VGTDLIGKVATLFDDDDMGNDNRVPQGDIGEDVPIPPIEWLNDIGVPGNADKFNAAYIRVRYGVLGQGNDQYLPFVRNCPQADGTAYEPTDAEVRSLTKFDNAYDQSQEFWIAYLLSAYQGPERKDGDPDTESVFYSLASSAFGAVLLLETMADYSFAGTDETAPDYSIEYDPRAIAVQAVGRSLGLEYGDGGLMSGTSAGFSPVSIAKLRSNVFPRVGGVAHFP